MEVGVAKTDDVSLDSKHGASVYGRGEPRAAVLTRTPRENPELLMSMCGCDTRPGGALGRRRPVPFICGEAARCACS